MKTLIALLSIVIGTSFYAQGQDLTTYLKENAVPIDTSINDLKDIDFLKSTLAGKRVIGMGEATHGTHEFQTQKIRTFKYLVTQMGFKLFGIEANFTRCRKVNDYILNGTGDAKKTISGMAFWMWNTREMLELVEWMRDYNKDKPAAQKIKFYGFDMQYDTYIIPQLTATLKKLDDAYFQDHFAGLIKMNIARAKLTDHQRDSIKTLLSTLKSYVNAKEPELLKIISKDEVAYLTRDIRLLEQCVELNRAQATNFNRMAAVTNARDRFMCENIQWILDHEEADSKIALWAHNLHIAKTATSRGAMGAGLKAAFKDQYYALGFDFNKGSFRAGDMRARKINVFSVDSAENGSSGYLFAQAGFPQFFIHINNAIKADPSTKKFLTKQIDHLAVGDVYTNEKYAYLKDAFVEMYDGLIFINETTPTIPIN